MKIFLQDGWGYVTQYRSIIISGTIYRFKKDLEVPPEGKCGFKQLQAVTFWDAEAKKERHYVQEIVLLDQ